MKYEPAQYLSLAVILLACSTACFGQVATGLPPFGTFSGGPFDTINNANLNVHFDIPIVSKAGRGLPFTYTLSYDNAVWSPVSSTGTQTWTPVANWGWRAVTEPVTGYVSYSVTQNSCLNHVWNIFANWAYHDTFGVAHPFPVAVSTWSSTFGCGGGPPGSGTGTATDGSGYTASVNNAPSATVTARSGTVISAPLQAGSGSGSDVDSNGNVITAVAAGGTTTFTDTLNTTALTASGSGTPLSPLNLAWTNPQSGTSSIKVNYGAFTVQTNFGCNGISEYGATQQTLVTGIILPDGTSYSFTYEGTVGHTGNVTGRLKSVTLPTGGTINYTYSGGSQGIICADGATATMARGTPDGNWTYTHTESGTAWTTTVLDPASNQTIFNTQQIYETERQQFQGTATLLRTTTTCYNGGSTNCNATSIALPITQRTVTPAFASNLQSRATTTYNSNGLPLELDEFDFGVNAPGALRRKTIISYATLGNNIFDRPSTISVQNGPGI